MRRKYAVNTSKIVKEIRNCGFILFSRGLVDTRSGNISVRYGDKIIIKKTGKSLPFLTSNDVVRVNIYRETRRDRFASSDLRIHREIYMLADKMRKDVGAVIHTHCPEAVVLSFYYEKIIPEDFEGKLFMPEIYFVSYDDVPRYVVEYSCCVAKGHGTFVGAKDLKSSLFLTLAMAHSLKIFLLKKLIEK